MQEEWESFTKAVDEENGKLTGELGGNDGDPDKKEKKDAKDNKESKDNDNDDNDDDAGGCASGQRDKLKEQARDKARNAMQHDPGLAIITPENWEK